jgi:hypothetical protein
MCEIQEIMCYKTIAILAKTVMAATFIYWGLVLYGPEKSIFSIGWKRFMSLSYLIFGVYQTIDLWFFFK